MTWFALAFLACILATATITDLKSRRIPNWLTASTALAGLAYHVLLFGLQGLGFSFGGIFLGIALLLIFYILGGMGAGDVKLLGAAGAWLGPAGVFQAFVFTAALGGLYAIILLVKCGRLHSFFVHYRMVFRTFICSGKIENVSVCYGEKLPEMSYGVVIAIGALSSAARYYFN
jgi:prepilin peptidase CpaA